VCVCVREREREKLYSRMCACASVCVCVCVCACVTLLAQATEAIYDDACVRGGWGKKGGRGGGVCDTAIVLERERENTSQRKYVCERGRVCVYAYLCV